MRRISVTIPEGMFRASTRIEASLGISRNAYIREAIERSNCDHRMAEISLKCRAESMRVNAEFENISIFDDAW